MGRHFLLLNAEYEQSVENLLVTIWLGLCTSKDAIGVKADMAFMIIDGGNKS